MANIAMRSHVISLGYCALFNTPALRSFNCLPHWQRNRGSLVPSALVVRGSQWIYMPGNASRFSPAISARICHSYRLA
jgi:hypothetical protein